MNLSLQIKLNKSFRLTFNQPNSFHLKTHSTDNTEELIINSDKNSTTSISSLNFIDTISSQQIQISHQNSISSCQQNFLTKQITNDFSINPIITLSQDLKSLPFKLLHENLQLEFPTNTSPFEISPQIKIHHEIKPV
jgi:hypothetical protein